MMKHHSGNISTFRPPSNSVGGAEEGERDRKAFIPTFSEKKSDEILLLLAD